jgi:Ca2+-binding EF-hand superfamily protein
MSAPVGFYLVLPCLVSSLQANAPPSFNPEEVDILRQCFAEHDQDETGFVFCGDLLSLLRAAGLEVAPATVDEVVASLEADAASQLTFSEFVDVASILAETTDGGGGGGGGP